ncbi:hypothetical protein AG1IA_10256 [Rhizoctonia solani AG-1 IA]|uniref:Uncharacterized protein n=1 Tax=Thanatephorus cucumeris (strain AG1-IA) TaxID=983506 RepID=L8WH56_THACA|nr:hypothetical protein AG1IA_10256 [Rhizoctonia solani AG-1 IA]
MSTKTIARFTFPLPSSAVRAMGRTRSGYWSTLLFGSRCRTRALGSGSRTWRKNDCFRHSCRRPVGFGKVGKGPVWASHLLGILLLLVEGDWASSPNGQLAARFGSSSRSASVVKPLQVCMLHGPETPRSMLSISRVDGIRKRSPETWIRQREISTRRTGAGRRFHPGLAMGM